MRVRLASRESRTVSVLRGSFGSEGGYSVPPMEPRITCPNGITSAFAGSMMSPRRRPVMVLP